MLTYFSFIENIFTNDLFFAGKIIMGFMILLFISTFLYLLYKIRIIIIKNNIIVSIHPFLMKKVKMDLSKIKRVKLKNWTAQNGTVYKRVSLNYSNSKLTFTDREFENFDALINEIPNINNKREKIDYEQAKSNLSTINLSVYLLSGFLVFIVLHTIWTNGFNFVVLSIFVCAAILLIASIDRKLRYSRIIKTAHS